LHRQLFKTLNTIKMKYIITGSTGHISKPLTEKLVAAGNQVTVISSSDSKNAEIKAIGATAAIGSIEDRDFLTKAFAGADAVYLMIPPKWTVTDWMAYQKIVADNYIAAVKANNIKYVLILSSVGAHMGQGCGPVDGTSYLEREAAKLTGSNVLALRPSYFFYNLLSQVGMIKHAGFVGSTQPADFKLVLTHPSDIADAAAAELLTPSFTGHGYKNIASDDSNTWAQITKALGTAIGKPELPYVELTDEQSRQGMLQAGLSQTIIDGYVDMGKALREGKMQSDFWANPPKTLGKVKLADFVKEFAAAYNAS
jgi:uncharacterized protein YbjT (DUF2867 family)